MRRRAFWAGLVAVLACVTALGADGKQTKSVMDHDQWMKYFEPREYADRAGKKICYRLFKPWKYSRRKKYPLLLYLHGAGAVGDDNVKQVSKICLSLAEPESQAKYPCFVLAPQCPADETWGSAERTGEGEGDVRYTLDRVIEIIEMLQKEFSIDPDRLYVTGISMGGGGTWRIIARRPDMFAAAVPLCGGGKPSTAPLIVHVPVWAFHGDADDTVPVEATRKMIQALKETGGAPKYSELPGVGHSCANQAYGTPELLPWMFDQSRSDSRKRKK